MTVRRVVWRAVLATLAAALAAGIASAVGVDTPHALGVGWGVLAVALVVGARGVVQPLPMEPLEAEEVGGRRDVDQLAWAMVEHRTHVRGVVVARVARIASARLAEHGLDLQRREDAAAIEALLGPTAWAVLRPDRDRPVLPRALDAALQAIERLELPGAPHASHAHAHDPNRTIRAD